MEAIEINGILWDGENYSFYFTDSYRSTYLIPYSTWYDAIEVVRYNGSRMVQHIRTDANGEEYEEWEEVSTGRRLPTLKEYKDLFALGYRWSEADSGLWVADDKLFFPADGFFGDRFKPTPRHINEIGKKGHLWTETYTINGTTACSVGFDENGVKFNENTLTDMLLSVRCVRDL